MLPAPHSFDPGALVGATLDGRYRLLEHIATGGMGAVFRAEHVYMRKQLAVKVLRPELSALPDIAERFRREAEIAASLDHENIVRVTDFGRTVEGWLFLAMELLQGESLHERLGDGDRLDPLETIRILVQICRGLDAAHRRNVVHRDLKPENVFLTRPSGVVKLLDFGIAKLTDPAASGQTQAGLVVGTPEYLSPEQAAGAAIDGRADLYAVGVIGWRMLVGHHPFHGDDARGLMMKHATQPLPSLVAARPDLVAWPALVATIERACAKDPAERQRSAAELCGALEACASPSAIAVAAAPTSATALLPVPPRRRGLRRALVALLACAVAALLAAGGAHLARWSDERPAARARELLAANRPAEARDVLAGALARRPADARLLLLQGHALHRIQGQGGAAIGAWDAALDVDPGALDDAALAALSSDLRDPALADRAARVLARAGEAALPVVLSAARTGPPASRLRALELAREIGPDDRVDLVAEYASLLGDPDCAVRRTVVRRLAEIGTADATAKLRELSLQTREVRGLFGFPQRVPVCGATEAAAALRKGGATAP